MNPLWIPVTVWAILAGIYRIWSLWAIRRNHRQAKFSRKELENLERDDT